MSRPSPHSEVQATPGAPQFGSRKQMGEQPSNGMLLPSSQASAPSGSPLPQTASVHTLGEPSHFLPSSTRQRSEQPSPATSFPSSHGSVGATTPSPQRAIWRQAWPATAQLKPGSASRHVSEQPSPETLLPSSQASSWVSSPLPQLGGATGSPSVSTQLSPVQSLPPVTGITPFVLPPLPMTGAPPAPGSVTTIPLSSPPAPQPASRRRAATLVRDATCRDPSRETTGAPIRAPGKDFIWSPFYQRCREIQDGSAFVARTARRAAAEICSQHRASPRWARPTAPAPSLRISASSRQG